VDDRTPDILMTAPERISIDLHPRPNFTEAIATLADRGRDLRVALFEDCPPEDRNAAYEPLAWFEDLIRSGTNSVMITVHADPILPIPWGLLHEYGVVAGGGDPCDGCGQKVMFN
jgi:hypothetical protein